MFIAKLIGPDGYVEQKQFTDHGRAKAWLNGEGLEKFGGDVERAELYEDNRLISCTRPPSKDDARRFEGQWWSKRA